MTTTFRAMIFGTAVAATLLVTLDSVTAAEARPVVRLDAVHVTAHRTAFDAEGNLQVERLDPVFVSAHRAAN